MVVGSLVALSGCSSAGSGGGQAPSADPDVATPSASPAAAAPLTCADLVGASDVDIALASPSAPTDFASLVSYPTPYDFASTAAGGIRCAWLADGSTGTYSKIIGEPGVPWLDVQILPGAAEKWTSYTFGDGPGTDSTTPFAGFDGAHSCGDPGCKATAAIGSSWVSILVHDPGFGVGDSLVGSSQDEIFAKLAPAATSLFSTLAGATPAQLDWPGTPARASDPSVEACSSFLKSPALANALGVATVGEYADAVDLSSDIVSLESVALEDAGFVTCSAEAGFDARASFVLALDNASIVDRIAAGLGPKSAEHLDTLDGQTGSEKAVSNCGDGRPGCDLWFSLGVDAIYVSSISSDSKAVAEAILAQAR